MFETAANARAQNLIGAAVIDDVRANSVCGCDQIYRRQVINRQRQTIEQAMRAWRHLGRIGLLFIKTGGMPVVHRAYIYV